MTDSLELADKVVLVTGGGQGIGAAIALAVAQAGATVAVMSRRPPDSTRDRILSQGGHAMSITGDVSSLVDAQRAINEVIDAFGHLDVLVNNAAVLEVSSILETEVDSFDRVMAVNVRGPFLMTQAATPVMMEQHEGVIINIGSDLAVRGRANYGAYAASKGALLQLTRTAAIELGVFGIRVVMLSPAVTNTQLAAPALADPEFRAELVAKGTLERINEPEDVAAAAVFLASPAARTVTGCNWPIDAGVLAR